MACGKQQSQEVLSFPGGKQAGSGVWGAGILSSPPHSAWVCEVQPWAQLCAVSAPSPTNEPRRPAASQILGVRPGAVHPPSPTTP